MLIAVLSLLSASYAGSFKLTEKVGDPDGANLTYALVFDAAGGEVGDVTGGTLFLSKPEILFGDWDYGVDPFEIEASCAWSNPGCRNGFGGAGQVGSTSVVDAWRGAAKGSIGSAADHAAVAFDVGGERAVLVFPWREALKRNDWAEFYCVDGACIDGDGERAAYVSTRAAVALRVGVTDVGGKRVRTDVQVWRQPDAPVPTLPEVWFDTYDAMIANLGGKLIDTGKAEGGEGSTAERAASYVFTAPTKPCAGSAMCVTADLLRTRVTGAAPRSYANALAKAVGITEGTIELDYSLIAADRTAITKGAPGTLDVAVRRVQLRKLEGTVEATDDGVYVTEFGYRVVGSSVADMRYAAVFAAVDDCDETDAYLAEHFNEVAGAIDHFGAARGVKLTSDFSVVLDLAALEDKVTLIFKVDAGEGPTARTERLTYGATELIDRIFDRNKVKRAESGAVWRVIATEEVSRGGADELLYNVTFRFTEAITVDARTGKVTSPTGPASLTLTSGETTTAATAERHNVSARVDYVGEGVPVVDACGVGFDGDTPLTMYIVRASSGIFGSAPGVGSIVLISKPAAGATGAPTRADTIGRAGGTLTGETPKIELNP
jgi:hypothetical protein